MDMSQNIFTINWLPLWITSQCRSCDVQWARATFCSELPREHVIEAIWQICRLNVVEGLNVTSKDIYPCRRDDQSKPFEDPLSNHSTRMQKNWHADIHAYNDYELSNINLNHHRYCSRWNEIQCTLNGRYYQNIDRLSSFDYFKYRPRSFITKTWTASLRDYLIQPFFCSRLINMPTSVSGLFTWRGRNFPTWTRTNRAINRQHFHLRKFYVRACLGDQFHCAVCTDNLCLCHAPASSAPFVKEGSHASRGCPYATRVPLTIPAMVFLSTADGSRPRNTYIDPRYEPTFAGPRTISNNHTWLKHWPDAVSLMFHSVEGLPYQLLLN